MKQKNARMIMILITLSIFCGCAGHNTVAGNVATGAAINAAAGVPGAGAVSLAAMAVDLFMQSGRPKVGKASPGLKEHLRQSPAFNIIERNGEIKSGWVSRKKEDGSLITKENAPKKSMEYMEAYMRSLGQYVSGNFGDTPEMQKKNLQAWEEGKMVVAEYHWPSNANLVFVSVGREPAEVMLIEEWAVRNETEKK
jgi:hypothetical protein